MNKQLNTCDFHLIPSPLSILLHTPHPSVLSHNNKKGEQKKKEKDDQEQETVLLVYALFTF